MSIDIQKLKALVLNMENDGTHVDVKDKPLLLRLRDGLKDVEKNAHTQYVEIGRLLRKKTMNPKPVPTPTPVPNPVPTPAPVPSNGKGLYVPQTQLSSWLAAHKNDPNYALLDTSIAKKATFIWLNGNKSDIDLVKSTQENCGAAIPCYVLYAIPDRDAQQYSAGGFKTVEDYNAWAGGIGWAIQTTGNKPCVVIVEADALGLLNDKPTTYPCINAAVDILKKNSNTKVFIDAPMWISANDMRGRVKGAGVERADGISVNVSGRGKTAVCEVYAKEVLNGLRSGLQYIVDVSRNGGNTKDGEWCNPIGEKLGADPQLVDKGQLYAYAWVKIPGESDGNCNGGPNAGALWIERAVTLAQK